MVEELLRRRVVPGFTLLVGAGCGFTSDAHDPFKSMRMPFVTF